MFAHILLAVLFMAGGVAPKLHLPGHYFFGHEIKINARVTVPVEKDNREVGVEWDCDTGGGYTSRQLDELVDWANHNFQIVLRPGKCVIRAVVKRAGGKVQYSAIQSVEVLSNRPQDGE